MSESKLTKSLIELCNEQFENPFIQRYAGASYECHYCGAIRKRDDSVNHSDMCPVVRYYQILKENQ